LMDGFAESVKAYSLLKEKHPEIPVLMGAGNVTELVDADSPGVNAVLAGIASELGVELLFTTEASPKTFGCVRELSTAARMMHLAKINRKHPKDLGIGLLALKDKRTSEDTPTIQEEKIRYKAATNAPDAMEATSYRIYVAGRKIRVVEYRKHKPAAGFTGTSAEYLYKTICAKSRIGAQHAAYLGIELAKAEIALKIGKNYTQDEKLF
ncbi:MAG: dihydropteroate synthase-like protein, partial [Candidatus Altiarchaeota archaeon]|nr:dihydropteroate synthase-like protein [Candidatus Altiarchaeota archaeon]